MVFEKICRYPRMLGFLLAFAIVVGIPYLATGEMSKKYFIMAGIMGIAIFPLLSFVIYYFLGRETSFNYKKFAFGLNVGNFLALMILGIASFYVHAGLSVQEINVFSYGMILSALLGWFLRFMYIYDEYRTKTEEGG